MQLRRNDKESRSRWAGRPAAAPDAEGERTAATPGSGTATTYSFNQAAELTSLTGPAGASSYTYDGNGLRATETVSGSTATFVWNDGSTPDLLTDGTNSYLYGPAGLPIEQVGSAGSFWFVHDQVGSTVLLLNASGAQAAGYTYTPYGLAAHTGTATTPLQYTGQYTDAATGLVYLRARYYDPATAQFLTVDPLVDSTHTPYAYVDDNPLNGADPTGLIGISGCLSALAMMGWGGQRSVCAVITFNCSTGETQIGGTATGGFGGGMPAVGVSVGPQISNANSVSDYGGWFGEVGGSADIGDYNFGASGFTGLGSKNQHIYGGGVGIGEQSDLIPSPPFANFEIHALDTDTATTTTFSFKLSSVASDFGNAVIGILNPLSHL